MGRAERNNKRRAVEAKEEIERCGRIFKSNTATGSKSRAVAMSAIGGNECRLKNQKKRPGREEQASRELLLKWKAKLGGLMEATPEVSNFGDWTESAVFCFANRSHAPAIPEIDPKKDEGERRPVVKVVVGERGSNLKAVDDMVRGVRVKGEEVWKLPRGAIRRSQMIGEGQSLSAMFDVSAARASICWR